GRTTYEHARRAVTAAGSGIGVLSAGGAAARRSQLGSGHAQLRFRLAPGILRHCAATGTLAWAVLLQGHGGPAYLADACVGPGRAGLLPAGRCERQPGAGLAAIRSGPAGVQPGRLPAAVQRAAVAGLPATQPTA